MTETLPIPAITSVQSWYGSNRILAPHVGKALEGCGWVGIPFVGGGTEILQIKARTIQCNDLHRHAINSFRVIANESMLPELIKLLESELFHPDALNAAQIRCAARETTDNGPLFGSLPDPAGWNEVPDVRWAADYLICSWMSRHGSAGTKNEFSAPQSLRWDAGGGGSSTHYLSMIGSLQAWSSHLQRCDFSTLDFREFLKKCRDMAGVGIFCDPPFPGPGDLYKHRFTVQDHRDLARILGDFHIARIVCRFYEHPLVRELYPEGRWKYLRLEGRKQTNDSAPELLIIGNGGIAA